MCAMPSLQPYAIDKDLFGPIKFMKNLCEVRELAQAEQTYIAWFAFPYLTYFMSFSIQSNHSTLAI